MNRREFLALCGTVMVSSLIPFGFNGWAASVVDKTLTFDPKRKRLIILFQRGAVDGLNLVVPFNESAYYDSRPSIAIPTPGSPLGALQLNATFGLHPAMEPVLPLWKSRNLAFVHACGSPNPTRSHFEAQDYMETGTPGLRSTKDGWLNRLLAVLSSPTKSVQGLSMGSISPLIMRGRMNVANFPSQPASTNVLDRPLKVKEYEELYRIDKELEAVLQEGLKSRGQLIHDLEEERKEANHGAPSPTGFEANCDRLAKVMARDNTMQVAFLDVGGWDTHINQGGSTGQLANHLKTFSKGVSAIVKGLDSAFHDTVVMVISEFGRTVKENGHAGTDHGHGNVMWVLGGAVRGGAVYGVWPGLRKDTLYENRDLAVTTDFRQVIGYVLQKHFQLSATAINTIFPNTPALLARGSIDGII